MKKHNLIGSIWLITIASALFAPAAYSQFHVGIDYRYCLGIREQMIGRELYIAEYDMHNYYLQLTAIYQITPQIATGIGISPVWPNTINYTPSRCLPPCVSAPSKAIRALHFYRLGLYHTLQRQAQHAARMDMEYGHRLQMDVQKTLRAQLPAQLFHAAI